MEIVYIIAWALAVRQNAHVPGFMPFAMVLMAAYLVILLVGLLYEWKKGALTWT
jgi:NADH:ubiquinone oxidoreductase subunit 3 (subunit A)